MIKYLSERKRRTFLRYMNGRKKRKNPKDDEEDYPEEKEKEVPTTRTREELLQKIAKLKLQDEGEFKDVLESDSEDSDSDDFSDVEED